MTKWPRKRLAEVTGIAWTDSTFNPWIGCTKVGPGCDHCYAEALDKRHRWQGDTHWGAGKPRVRTSAANWRSRWRGTRPA
jgi:protein gp37